MELRRSTRRDGVLERGEWRRTRVGDSCAVFCCPRCEMIVPLVGYFVDVMTGRVSPPVRCPRCGFSADATLSDFDSTDALDSGDDDSEPRGPVDYESAEFRSVLDEAHENIKAAGEYNGACYMHRQVKDEFARMLIAERAVPRLGCATTRELLDELRARIDADGKLDYRTVDGG